ncbi:Protein of unknown function (DUF2971) [Eilatimonas milleporae]|uniref:DUF2971 family protein n=1 Tax=Eilatimonas milleporae TaxID=911205 RepID=A0A3M0CDK6_9PROT|nr:Protein of unknown function (DUF2971) [Eilatimonas milleporae]
MGRQTVYFAPPEHLNDPMEGLRQIYWHGDRITWRNLLRHYVICLQNRLFQALSTDDSERLDPQTISVFQTLDNLPTPEARSLCEACIAAVEAGELHTALLDLLACADRDIGFSELQLLLRTVHIDWLGTVYGVFVEHGLAQQGQPVSAESSSLVDVLRKFQHLMPQVREQVSDDGVEIIHNIRQIMSDQTTLLAAYQHADVLQPKRASLFFEFTTEYLTNLMKLVYPPWYVACFSGRHDNAAMWSYYADNHRGCCLVFRADDTETGRSLLLNGPTGYGSDGISRSVQNLPLEPVRYTAGEQRIEFFTNIGRLPLAPLARNWFQDNHGRTSPLAQHLNEDRQEAWGNAYWENFTPPLLRKLPDWQHEKELRIVLSDILNIRGTDEGRTFTYDYNTLDGIIFGINTNLSDKVRIMHIVNAKLASRSVPEPFKFYQARYNARTERIEAHHFI